MNKGRVIVVLDGQAGSSGKGKVSGHVALHHSGPFVAINNFMSNAGHTVVLDNGDKVMTQHLPSSIVHPNATLCIGPGAAITPEILASELDRFEEMGLLNGRKVFIHPRAMVITEEHRIAEREMVRSGSTFKGCGVAQAQKIVRDPKVKLWKDLDREIKETLGDLNAMMSTDTYKIYSTLSKYTEVAETQFIVNNAINEGTDVVIEGSQGYDLDINYGLPYPHTTSRQCNAGQLVADCGISPMLVTDIVMVIRPYPIRISNQTDLGIEISSGNYDGANEITWDIVKQRCGAPDEVELMEMTTVTKKMRRVFELNMNRLVEAVMVNRPTEIALNFGQYIDYSILGRNEAIELTDKILEFKNNIESATGVRVTLIGTGARDCEMINIDSKVIGGRK